MIQASNDPIVGLIGSWASDINLWSILLRIAASAVLSAMIGTERSSKRHSAGLRTFMLSEEGREVVLYRMGEGEIDLLSASCVVNQISFETQMVADIDCTLLVIPATCLAEFKRNNLAVRCFIYEKLGERFSDVMKLMQTMLFTRIDKRIAALLREKAEASGTDEIRITHEEIAALINSSREVVSRTLKEMERSGLLSLGRGRITLLTHS